MSKQKKPSRTASRVKRLLAVPVFVAVVATLAMLADNPPAALPDDAPAERFSAARAMAHVKAIARKPHPAGSSEAARVRGYILDELDRLGFQTEVQTTEVVFDYARHPRRVDAATVKNIVARKPGREGGPGLALMVHYDSRPQAPGAGDDASGVATLLETARALREYEPLARDLYLVFTDAEERGLFGAQGFMRQHPAADNIGLVLNFEARGTSGPVNMFETSDRNGALIDALSDAVPHVTAASLAYAVYKRMPNDTDLSIVKAAGVAGMNFAFVDGFYDYHTPGDHPDNLSPDSLQQMGGYALSLTRHFGHADLPPERTRDAVFYNVVGDWFVSHSQAVGQAAALAATVVVALLLWRLHRTGQARALSVLRGGIGFVLFLGTVVLLVDGLSSLLAPADDNVAFREVFAETRLWLVAWLLLVGLLALVWTRLLTRGVGYPEAAALTVLLLVVRVAAGETGWTGIGGPLAIGVVLATVCRPSSDARAQFGGALAVWAVLLATVSLTVPTAGYLFAWPLLVAAATAHWVSRRPDPAFGRGTNLAVLLAGAIPGVFWFAGLVYSIHLALGVGMPAISAAVAALPVALLIPVLSVSVESDRGELLGAVAVAMLIFFGTILATTGFDSRHRQPSEIFYWYNADTGEQYWAAEQDALTPWMQGIFGEAPVRMDWSELLPHDDDRDLRRSPAPNVAMNVPKIEFVSETLQGETRSVTFRLTPEGFGERLNLALSTEGLGTIMLGSRKLAAREEFQSDWWHWRYFAVPPTGIELTVLHDFRKTPVLKLQGVRYALPEEAAAALAPRPDDEMARPYSYSDATVVTKTYSLE